MPPSRSAGRGLVRSGIRRRLPRGHGRHRAAAGPRTIRVHNRGGLDWDGRSSADLAPLPAACSARWPVYCRAEGYDFGVIDENTVEGSTSPAFKPSCSSIRRSSGTSASGGRFTTSWRGAAACLVLGDHTDVFGLMSRVQQPARDRWASGSGSTRPTRLARPGAGARQRPPTQCAGAGTTRTRASPSAPRWSYPDRRGRSWSAAMVSPTTAFARTPSAAFWAITTTTG